MAGHRAGVAVDRAGMVRRGTSVASAISSMASGRPAADTFAVINPATGKELAQVSQASERMSMPRLPLRARRFPLAGARRSRARAVSVCDCPRPVQRNARLLRCSSRWTTASRFARRATSIFRWWRGTSITTPAGRSCSTASSPGMQPVGVVGQIIPWNFPLLMLAWKIAPALAAGNTVVLKPAEFTPLTALCFAELLRRDRAAGGRGQHHHRRWATGAALVDHPDVDKIAFTGSTEVGRSDSQGDGRQRQEAVAGAWRQVAVRRVRRRRSRSAVEGVVDAIWFNQGQVCCAGSRLLVQEGIAETLTRSCARGWRRCGSGRRSTNRSISARSSPVQLERIRRWSTAGVRRKARRAGSRLERAGKGLFYPPTLFTNVSPSSTIAQEEIFGPVLVPMTFRTPDEAVELANNTTVWSGGECLEREPQYGARCGAAGQGRRRLDQLHQPVRRGERLWRLSRERVWARGWPGGDVRIPCAWLHDGCGRTLRAKPSVRRRTRRGESMPGERYFARSSQCAIGNRGESISLDRPRSKPVYIGGKQARPDSGYSLDVYDGPGQPGRRSRPGNRKDIRNAVEAARAAAGWSRATAHLRAQVLYYIGENLAAARARVCARDFVWRPESPVPVSSTLPCDAASRTLRGPTSTMGRCITRRSAT